MTLLLIKSLENIVENPWLRVGASLLLVGCSYPILFGVDRANTELLTAASAAGALYYYSRGQYLVGTLCLLPGMCFKPYMPLFLVLLLRERKWLLSFAIVAAFAFITAFCAHFFAGSAQEVWHRYLQMMTFHQNWVFTDAFLEESSSPWPLYKLALITASGFGLISPVEFDLSGPLIRTSYTIYAAGTVVVATMLSVYACFIEKEFKRCAIPMLLFIGMVIPISADYRMIYTCIALAFLIPIRTRRAGDFLALILMAFVIVPKKEIFLYFPDYPRDIDISIQVVLNPICTLAAMTLLLYGGWLHFDPKWTKLRFQRFVHSIPIIGPRWS